MNDNGGFLHVLPQCMAHQLQVFLEVLPEELWQLMWSQVHFHQLQNVSSGCIIVAADPEQGRVHDGPQDIASSGRECAFWRWDCTATGVMTQAMTHLGSVSTEDKQCNKN